VNAVLVAILMVGSLLKGQLPPLPPLASAPVVQEPGGLPALPALPALESQGLMPVSGQQSAKPPALVPVNPEPHDTVGPVTNKRSDPLVPNLPSETKPPPFKLIEIPGPRDTGTPVKPTLPLAAAELLPPGSVALPCLVLGRTPPPAGVKAGQAFSYAITVRNAGTVPAVQARLEEVLPQGARYVGGQPAALNQGDRLVWDLQNIAPGAEQRIVVEVESAQAGAWKSQAGLTVTVSSGLETQINAAPLQMLTVSGPASVPVGHPVTFVIRLTNTTAAPMADVVLGIRMSSGLQHLQGDAIEGSLGDLAPGKTRELTLDAVTSQTGRLTVDATLLTSNKAVVSAQAAVTATEQPVLSLKLNGPPAPSSGTQQDFKLEVANRSTTEVRDVVVTEMLPEGFEFVTAEGGSYDRQTRTIRWAVGTLAPGQGQPLGFRAAIRGETAQLNRASARAAGGIEAILHTILRVGR
jgi:uncharacterized repeat protein (TIGR01451 family)